jgi:methionyl-tRNA formyltransferase
MTLLLSGLSQTLHVIFTSLPTHPEARPEPVRTAAEGHSIPVFQKKSLRAADVEAAWKQSAPELVILAYVTVYVPDNLLSIPSKGSICFHPSLLPLYRGGNAIQWALRDGVAETGVSWFWVEPAQGSKV